MVRRWVLILVVVLSVTITFVLTAGLTMTWALSYMQSRQVIVNDSDYKLLDEIKGMMKSYSLEVPSDEKLLDVAAHAMVSESGDVYAQYFTEEEYAQFVKDQTGNYVGIGVTVQMDLQESRILVTHVISGGPADQAGIVAGDVVISVNGQSTAGMTTSELADLVRGEEDTEVTVGMQHADGSKTEYTIVRKAVTEDFVIAEMLDNGILYVKITQFAGDADYEFVQLTQKYIKQGAKGMVIDLRYNPGGDKDIVCHIADTLFPAGPIIIREDRDGNRIQDSSDSSCLNIPLVVLGNGYSASASELLIGGIQDYKVGTFIGTQTYGKGVVQTFLHMPDGKSVIKLTTDRYLTPAERSIHGVGCTPDIYLEPSEELENNPALIGTDKDNQLQKALEILEEEIK